MSTPQKRKGSAFELEVARYLAANGFPYAERRYGAGRRYDTGDINGLPGVVIECKAHKSLDLSTWVNEAEIERVHANADLGIVVAKRRGHSVAGAYAILPLWQLAQLLREADR